jgi:hypothetical protein
MSVVLQINSSSSSSSTWKEGPDLEGFDGVSWLFKGQ